MRLQSQDLDQRAAAARVEAEARQARLRAEADAELAKDGLVASLNLKLSQSAAAELENRERIEQQRASAAREHVFESTRQLVTHREHDVHASVGQVRVQRL